MDAVPSSVAAQDATRKRRRKGTSRVCMYCSREFKRIEHLDRHLRTREYFRFYQECRRNVLHHVKHGSSNLTALHQILKRDPSSAPAEQVILEKIS